jgi:hypothetical protein
MAGQPVQAASCCAWLSQLPQVPAMGSFTCRTRCEDNGLHSWAPAAWCKAHVATHCLLLCWLGGGVVVQASDQYLLEGLKRLCEAALAEVSMLSSCLLAVAACGFVLL